MVSVPYFLDQMQIWEAYDLIEMIEYSDRTGWEQTRDLMYVEAQTHSTKKIKPTDLRKFAWDRDPEEEKKKGLKKTISLSEKKALLEKAERIRSTYLNKKENG